MPWPSFSEILQYLEDLYNKLSKASSRPNNQAPSLANALNSDNPISPPLPKKPPLKINHDLLKSLKDKNNRSEKTMNEAKEEIKKILTSIWERLSTGLQDAWETVEGIGDLSGEAGNVEGFNSQESKDKIIELRKNPEEQWARLITEMFLCVSYGGCGQQYFSIQNKDQDIFKAFGERDLYPLWIACQHACTLAVLSRGVKFKTYASQVPNAGGGNAHFKSNFIPPGKAVDDKDRKKLIVSNAVNEGIGPGSVFTFNGKDAEGKVGFNIGSAHIAFVLRMHKDKRQLQLFDTGAMGTGLYGDSHVKGKPLIFYPTRIGPEYATEPSKHIDADWWTDYQWAKEARGPRKGIYVGLGVLTSPDPKTFEAAVDELRRKRPLGFARLVISIKDPASKRRSNTKPENVLFHTPLLLMWGKENNHNFSIARYLWSLRELSGGAIEAKWLISTPMDGLAQALLDSKRENTLTEIIKHYLAMPPPPKKPEIEDKRKKHTRIIENGKLISKDLKDIMRIIDVGTLDEPAGKVQMIERYHGLKWAGHFKGDTVLDQTHWNKPGGIVELTAKYEDKKDPANTKYAIDFDGFPYFKGDWDGKEWNKF